MKETVTGERERIDLDFGLLPRADKANIMVRYHGIDFAMTIGGNHHKQGLCRRYDPANCVN